jgi:hypothetical protein
MVASFIDDRMFFPEDTVTSEPIRILRLSKVKSVVEENTELRRLEGGCIVFRKSVEPKTSTFTRD